MAVDIVTGFDSLAVVFAIGLTLTLWVIVPAAGFRERDQARVQLATVRCLGLCLALLWLTSLAWLWTRTASMSGQPLWAAFPVVPTVLFRSHFGAVWWLRAAAVAWATLALIFLARRGNRAGYL